jgi:4-hydroxybenzoate polyprenyltransferase
LTERSTEDADSGGPPSATREKGPLGTVRTFAELVKFEHSVFALPYAFIGAIYGAATVAATGARTACTSVNDWVALSGWPTWPAVLWVAVAMVGARSFAFIVNRAVDREIDARNPRTAGRAVPAGLVKAWELWLFAGVVLAAFLVAVWQLHPITRWLWPLVLAAFVAYPYMKRFTPLCHHWLGLCLGLAPVGAWVAVTGDTLDWRPWAFGLAVTTWTAGFDIIYATQDVDSDRSEGVHSVPADFGVASGLRQTRLLHLLTVALLLGAGWGVGAGWPYYAGAAVAAVLLAYENAIVRPDDLSRVNAAFFTVNGIIAMVVFAGVLADRLLV